MKPLVITGIATSALIVALAVFAKIPTYHLAPISLIPLTWLPVWLRRKLDLQPMHYLLFCVAILLHMSGALGFYQHSPFPISFDIVVHFYFAFAVAFLLHHAIAVNFPLKPWQVNVTTLLFMMGFGALHEIMEFCSYLLLGEEKGMLKPRTSYQFDTARDLTNNLLGTLLALIIIAIVRAAMRRSPAHQTIEADKSPAAAAV